MDIDLFRIRIYAREYLECEYFVDIEADGLNKYDIPEVIDYLAYTEDGRRFKVRLIVDKDGVKITNVIIKYLNTVNLIKF